MNGFLKFNSFRRLHWSPFFEMTYPDVTQRESCQPGVSPYVTVQECSTFTHLVIDEVHIRSLVATADKEVAKLFWVRGFFDILVPDWSCMTSYMKWFIKHSSVETWHGNLESEDVHCSLVHHPQPPTGGCSVDFVWLFDRTTTTTGDQHIDFLLSLVVTRVLMKNQDVKAGILGWFWWILCFMEITSLFGKVEKRLIQQAQKRCFRLHHYLVVDVEPSRRPPNNAKVVLMSAAMDSNKIARYFARPFWWDGHNCPKYFIVLPILASRVLYSFDNTFWFDIFSFYSSLLSNFVRILETSSPSGRWVVLWHHHWISKVAAASSWQWRRLEWKVFRQNWRMSWCNALTLL